MKRYLLLLLALTSCARAVSGKVVKVSQVETLRNSATKIDFAISSTKEMIQRSRGAEYTPDMYMRLAELYTERARHSWLITYETLREKGETSRNFDAPEARLLKSLAIGIYDRVPREFPKYARNDEALFLMAHEYREMGEFDNMTSSYEKLIATYPKSNFRMEALLVLGDEAFDRADLDKAEERYNQVLAEPASKVHSLARYKLGWVRINKGDCKAAVGEFEKILRDRTTPRGPQSVVMTQKSVNLMREALSDIAYCYSDVYGAKPANQYLRDLAASSSDYVNAIRRATNRFALKQMYVPAAAAVRDVLDAAAGDEEAVEAVRKLYDNVTKANLFDRSPEDVERIGRVYEKRVFDTRLDAKTKAEIATELEVYARDIATKTDLLAKEKKKLGLHSQSADAYTAYLRYFQGGEKALEMAENRADALLQAERHFEAALAFEKLALAQKGEPATLARVNAISEFQKALDKPSLPRFERVTARGAIGSIGRVLLTELAPNDEKILQIKISMATAAYDSGEYQRASELGFSLARQFPTAEAGVTAAQLSLDSLRLLEDFEGMVTIGKLLLDDPKLGDGKLRQEIAEIVRKGEQRQIAEMAIGSAGGKDDQLQTFARKNKGTSLGEEALYNALLVARTKDADQFYSLGREFLKDYPKSTRRLEVTLALAGTATDRADFTMAAAFLMNAYELEPNGKGADERLFNATVVRGFLGDANVVAALKIVAAKNPEKAEAIVANMVRLGYTSLVEQLMAAGITKGGLDAGLRAYFASKRGDEEAAQQAITDALKASATSDIAIDAVAKARFLSAEQVLATFTEPIDASDPVRYVTTKQAMLANVDKAFAAVLQAKDAELAIAALARLALAYDLFGLMLKKTALPEEISEEERAQLTQILAARADEASKRAGEFRKTCATRAKELRVFSEPGRACLTGKNFTSKVALYPEATPKRAGEPSGAAELRVKLTKTPRNADLMVQLGELYLGQGDIAMTLLILDKAEEVDPRSAAVHNLRGVALFKAQDPTGAFQSFKKAAAIDDKNRGVHLNLAAHYAFFGYDDDARAELKIAGGQLSVRGDADEHPELQSLVRLAQGGQR